ncbi:mannosyl-oligosaccharide glucosidase GCS1 isoform X2 [Canna indica]|uniref:Mannosyl-oligosaccharide glucosidase n=1 Tax=Canna indica TaxID=4628 RepID=A0AAQ3K890_9LILI|nr:mannosyl-oligosaccharide glucosidase GCS1 isoform X2 [Canna indica]
MSGGSRRTARNRARPSPGEPDAGDSLRGSRTVDGIRKVRSRDHGPIRLMDVSLKTLLALGFCVLALIFAFFFIYNYHWETRQEDPTLRRLKRVVTPLPAPKMMDLPQFQGEHKESLYWGTYRPHVYLGIRARTPRSLISGLMWIGIKNGQYFLRHVCQDSDELSTYGWRDHNGRDYGHQLIVDQGFSFITSFLKEKKEGSAYGGDWAVRLDLQNTRSDLHKAEDGTVHFFFYVADEEGNTLGVQRQKFESRDATLLAFGTRNDIGGWELHLDSQKHLDTHFAGFKTIHMHNLTELVQGTLAFHARRTGQLQLPDTIEDSSNVIVTQISTTLPAKFDIAFISGTNMKGARADERINGLTGAMLSTRLEEKQKEFEDKYIKCFNLKDKTDSDPMLVGRAAIGNLLGGVGYFYGQSKIALPEGFTQENGDKFISYWPAALFTAVPSRSFFPRGFLWDEGFHQLIIGRWDVHLSMDIIGHWLDLINIDGWIPREQILGAEALSKVPAEFVLQYPTNGNPPTLFLVLRDLLNGIKMRKFSAQETKEVTDFLNRAYIRLNTWFQWFNSTQSGKDGHTFYWHGRDNTTTKELNPKTLTSGLDDYPRASHPNDEEHHLDLRCWMLLAADCMNSIAELLKVEDSVAEDYHRMSKQLSDFRKLNQIHLDNGSGAYFDFGLHAEKVRLRWHQVKSQDNVQKELVRETLETPQLKLVPHLGYVSLFPFMMGIIPPESPVLQKQLELISNRSTLWTDYGVRSLSRTSSLYMKRNTEHDPPYWRGPIWINMNYMILSALHHYSQEDGPYKTTAEKIYGDLRSNLIRNIVRNYYETGFLWEQYDQKNKGKGKGARPFTGWTSLVLLMMAETYPSLRR